MSKFEYKTIDMPLSFTEQEFIDILNKYGSEGWEAIHFYSFGPNNHYVLFKRVME